MIPKFTPKQAEDVVTQIQAVAWSFNDQGRQAAYSELTEEVALLAASYILLLKDFEVQASEIQRLKEKLGDDT